ncbi:MAG TPA: hypothetical protein VGK00_16205 [Anaerolineales bacterium]|jgi:photosystem II stability/assembly factor-like uncharacterized protein
MKKLLLALIVVLLSACDPFQVIPATSDVGLIPSRLAGGTIGLTTQPLSTLQPAATQLPPGTAVATAMPVTSPPRPLIKPVPRLPVGQKVTITSIQMIDSQTGWAVESTNHILHTIDAGNTWQDHTPPEGAFMEGGFFASDADTAWAVSFTQMYAPISSAVVWHTSDAGHSWQAGQPFPTNLDSHGKESPADFFRPRQLYFVDRQTGWLLVDTYFGMQSIWELLFRTVDGGDTWTVVNDHHTDLVETNGIGVVFIDPLTGWYGQNTIAHQWEMLRVDDLVAAGGWKLIKTFDGGRSFNASSLLPLPPELQRTEFVGKTADCGETRMLPFAPRVSGIQWTCWIYAKPRQDFNFFAISTDGGGSWHSWLASGNEFFLNALTGWRLFTPAGLSKYIQKTTDGGITWVKIKEVAWQAAQFDFVSDQVGWAVVKNGDVTAILRTADGGLVWAELKPRIAATQ